MCIFSFLYLSLRFCNTIGHGPAKHLVQKMKAMHTTEMGHGTRGEPRRGSGRKPEKSSERAKGNIGARGISVRGDVGMLIKEVASLALVLFYQAAQV